MPSPKRLTGISSAIVGLLVVGLRLSNAEPAQAIPIQYAFDLPGLVGAGEPWDDPDGRTFGSFTLDPRLDSNTFKSFEITFLHGTHVNFFTSPPPPFGNSCIPFGGEDSRRCTIGKDLGSYYLFVIVYPHFSLIDIAYIKSNLDEPGPYLRSVVGNISPVPEQKSGASLMIGLLTLAGTYWMNTRRRHVTAVPLRENS